MPNEKWWSTAECGGFYRSIHSRHDLGVVEQVLQWVAAGEVVVQVCGVADDAHRGAGRVDEACDDD